MKLTETQLKDELATVLGISPEIITADALMVDLGLDSMGLIMLVEKWRADGYEVEFNDLIAAPTFGQWLDILST
ncbi:phosphopantetheine-binding protein [Corynebacterium sp. ES2794-CONJ1]|uniref:phosphopantetheine-binding protein n=1 Tax=unclassified Corynebacterium TaxID=2624378 RepID=UPI002168363E|nr:MULTISPECIES: phosphopantetheine-binding protein [unclassified Corynebacterium]MCS4489638.1 phosphopantetheine-binding protein [Corynebacterium sp. ES2775-CONJ]MCS4491353.1 phosphopantetheine-binding protein [Corynebacterium sp. ES2715-CONJ3]MCS4531549.1 phosphopantetheine-binding protein [Corynebacterium sp. ES2730-CONJ]MCU9518946.1 phosphopantetheine-binding protein [Corynebacterium sp. ES2794-CONJ1]